MPIAMPKLKKSESNPEALARVLSQLSSAQWTTTTPEDQFQTYKSRTIRSTKVMTFEPTAASEQVLMQARLTADKMGKPMIKGQATHRLSHWGKRLMKELPEIQIIHRSRPAGLMSNRLQLNEMNRRVENAKANKTLLDSISLPPSIAAEIASIKRDALLKRLKLDEDTLTSFIKEHEDSSIVPGLKWGQLTRESVAASEAQMEVPMDFWKEYFEIIKGAAEQHFFSGESFNTPFNFGSRARADQKVFPDEIHYDLEVSRTRIVMFTPILSTVFAFVPDKKGFYKEVIDGAMNVFQINDHFMTPMTEGGQVYGAAADALHNSEDVVICLGDDVNIFKNGKQMAFDGVNWETQVGTILGKPFHGSKTYFGGMYHVPSGVYDTSLDDTLASMWVYSQNDEMKKGTEIPGIMEREAMDEEVNFMLGLSYKEDPNTPRLQGLKLVMDKSQAAVPLPTGRVLELPSKKDEEESERWYLGYHGTTPTGAGLLNFLEKVSADDFRGGEVTDWISEGFPMLT